MVVQEELEVKKLNEFWNYYDLDDGSILKIKTILISVYNEGKDTHGTLCVNLQTVNVVGAKPPKEPIEQLTEIKELGFKENKEINNNPWNEYTLEDNFVLMIKPSIAQVDRTGVLDPRGIPIYNIQSQVTVKFKT